MNDIIIEEITDALSQIIGTVELSASEDAMCVSCRTNIKNSAYRIDTLIGNSKISNSKLDSFTSYTKQKTVAMKNSLDGKSIMIVDDVVENQNVIESICSLFNCHIECVSSGAEALLLYKSFKPDIVFMDIIMPGIQGDETAKLLKDMGCNAIIIAVSALKEYHGKYLSILDAWLPKPFTIDQILDTLNGCIFCDSEEENSALLVEKNNLTDLSKKEKEEIFISIRNGAISELELIIDGLDDSKSKKWLQTQLSKMNLKEILTN